jgi:hypothetical protein
MAKLEQPYGRSVPSALGSGKRAPLTEFVMKDASYRVENKTRGHTSSGYFLRTFLVSIQQKGLKIMRHGLLERREHIAHCVKDVLASRYLAEPF